MSPTLEGVVLAPKRQAVSGLGDMWEQAGQASTVPGPVKTTETVLSRVLQCIEVDCLCPAPCRLQMLAMPCQAVSSTQSPGGSVLPNQE